MKITKQVNKDTEEIFIDISPEFEPQLVKASVFLDSLKKQQDSLQSQLDKIQADIAELEDNGVVVEVKVGQLKEI